MKALIGIGDSWTQGEGGYTDEVWKANNGRMWKKLSESMHLIPMEQENSWVNRLAQNLDYASINLGQRAIGNRGAVRSLYLNDVSQYTSGTVVLILTGFERFDLFNEHWQDDHYKFHTLWPFLDHKDIHKLYQKVYSEKAAAVVKPLVWVEHKDFYANFKTSFFYNPVTGESRFEKPPASRLASLPASLSA